MDCLRGSEKKKMIQIKAFTHHTRRNTEGGDHFSCMTFPGPLHTFLI